MTSKERKFIDRVNELLKPRSDNPARVHSGSIGSNEAGTLWVLGVTLPDARVTSVHAPITDDDAYSEEAAIDVAQRLHTWVAANETKGTDMAAKKETDEERIKRELTDTQNEVAHSATMLIDAAEVGDKVVTIPREDWDAFKEDYDAWAQAGANLIKHVRANGG